MYPLVAEVDVVHPHAVCWSEELEWALMLKDKPIDTYLLELLTDPAKEGWDISADLVGIEMGRNKVLDQAWNSCQWGKPPEGWEDLQRSNAPTE